MLFNILALISVLICITLLKRLVAIFPSLAACILRWKESVNLEASVKLSNDRDRLALAMVVPFCLACFRFRLYDPAFLENLGENLQLCIVLGVFISYFLLRTIMSAMVRPRKMNSKLFKTAEKASFTFFIILTLLLLTIGGILSFIGVDIETIRGAMLWISAGIYAISLLRKTQIFASGCSIFTAFLYLCALEIFPTGALVASALIL